MNDPTPTPPEPDETPMSEELVPVDVPVLERAFQVAHGTRPLPGPVLPGYTDVPTGEALAETKVPLLPLPTRFFRQEKSSYRATVASVREMVAREGLVANYIDMMKELAGGGFENKCKKQWKPLFDHACYDVNNNLIDKPRGMLAVLMKWVYGWHTAGMCAVLVRSEARPVPMRGTGAGVKYTYPVEMTYLDPVQLDLDEIYTTGNVYLEPDDTFYNALKKVADLKKYPFVMLYPPGKRTDKDPPNVYKQQDIIELLEKKSRKLPLPVASLYLDRWVDDDTTIYPTPELLRTFDPVNDKRLLRSQDRSLLTKLINLILHVTVASPIPGKPVSKKTLQETRDSLQQQAVDDPAHFQVAVTPDTQNFQWVNVPSGSMLQQEHYRVLNFEVLSSLLGLVANMLLAENGQVDLQLINKTLMGKSELCVQRFKTFLETVYEREIIRKNKLETKIVPGSVSIRPRRTTLFETDAYKSFIATCVKMGVLPAKVLIEEINEDYDTTLETLEYEQKIREKKRILVGFPAYNQIFTDLTKGPGTTKETTTTPSDGRPEGTTDDTSTDTDEPDA